MQFEIVCFKNLNEKIMLSDGKIVEDSYDILMYTFFIINIVCTLFVSFGYALLAYKFLEEQFYKFIGVGFFTNAVYLMGVAYFQFLSESNNWRGFKNQYLTIILSLISTIFFHIALYNDYEKSGKKWLITKTKPAFIIIIVLFFILTGFIFNKYVSENEIWILIFKLPSIVYSLVIILLVSDRFFTSFPEEEFGISTRLLYWSWFCYAILQIFSPLNVFESIKLIKEFTLCLFVVALFLKIIGIIGLFNLLQSKYSSLQDDVKNYSVMTEVGEIAAGLFHNISTPFGLVIAKLELLKKQTHDKITKQFIADIEEPLETMSVTIKLVSDIRLDPENAAVWFKPTSVRLPVPSARGIYKEKYGDKNLNIIYLEKDVPTLHIRSNKNLLADAFFQILKNAKEALATNVEIEVLRCRRKKNSIEFLFFNNGVSISEDEIKHCFDPGWSSQDKKNKRELEGNVGMGLFMCSKIVELHKGEVEIFNMNESLVGNFSKSLIKKHTVCVRITLPLTPAK
jgi:signal transduction histidine kinase